MRTGYLRHPARARAEPDPLAELPEALIIVDENDVLRDEGEAYARTLSDAGVRVTSVRYNGTIHDFVMLDARRFAQRRPLWGAYSRQGYSRPDLEALNLLIDIWLST